MEPKPHKIKWENSLAAAKWPEGSTVLEVLIQNGKPVLHTIRCSTYHRPDWLTPNHENYNKHLAKSCEYCLISLPK